MITPAMMSLLAVSFRYFFVFYLVYFLWQGITYIRIERGLSDKNPQTTINKQKMALVFLHIQAFFLLWAGHNTTAMVIGAGWLCVFFWSHYLLRKTYPEACPLIWNGFFFLTSVGSLVLARLNLDLANRQLLWLAMSVGVMGLLPVVIRFLPRLERLHYLYLGLGLLLLSATFVLGTEEFGSLRWIQLGGFGFSPAEAVSFLYILYLATAFRNKLNLMQLMLPTIMAAIHIGLLALQRNLGGSLLFFFAYMILMYVSTGKWWLFIAGLLLFGMGATAAYHWFEHVQVRVLVWQDPWVSAHGMGFQTIQSLFAMGTWGSFGSGLGQGIPGVVPVVARDLTFAAITEEMGWLFGLGMIGVYLMLFYRGTHVALRAPSTYDSLLVVGFTGVLAFQTFLIIGGTLNFIPLTGITMPFVSYGGSSLLVSTAKIGMIQWVYCHSQRREA